MFGISKSSVRALTGKYAVLDVGTSKTACFIADIDAGGNIAINGIGHQLSRGIRSGVITDFHEAETSIVAAVHAAEQMAGTTIENVMVSLTGGVISRQVTVEMALIGGEVSERDILDILEQGRASLGADEQDIVHTFPVSYCLDATNGIQDPRQMVGERLGADLHLVTVAPGTTRNLAHCIARCHLNISEYIIASHAAGLSCLEPDERELGVIVIDMGGGTTGFSIFLHGRNVFSGVVPLGGVHVTNDIAKGLSTTLTHAERLKTLHGSCMPSTQDAQVMISVPLLGEEEDGDESNTMPRSMLVNIIRPRMEEIFELIKQQIERSGVEHFAARRVVLTGGASQLIGVREMAVRMLGKQVRLGKPRISEGIAEAVTGPAFSTGLGMLHAIVNKPMEERLFETVQARGSWWSRFKRNLGS